VFVWKKNQRTTWPVSPAVDILSVGNVSTVILDIN
jgi:hypothetical protein